jgi:hypothetical protein
VSESSTDAISELRGALEQLPLLRTALEKIAEEDARRERLSTAAATRMAEVQAAAEAALQRVEVAQAREKTPPRGGRPKTQIREETRRRVRRLLASHPEAGWPAIAQSTGLSEYLARRVLREERARAREETPQLAGGNPAGWRLPR